MAVLSIAEYARRALLAHEGRPRPCRGRLIIQALLLLIGKPFEPPALPPTQRGRPLSGLLELHQGVRLITSRLITVATGVIEEER